MSSRLKVESLKAGILIVGIAAVVYLLGGAGTNIFKPGKDQAVFRNDQFTKLDTISRNRGTLWTVEEVASEFPEVLSKVKGRNADLRDVERRPPDEQDKFIREEISSIQIEMLEERLRSLESKSTDSLGIAQAVLGWFLGTLLTPGVAHFGRMIFKLKGSE